MAKLTASERSLKYTEILRHTADALGYLELGKPDKATPCLELVWKVTHELIKDHMGSKYPKPTSS
jgi:hypothetical protein